MLRWPGYCSPIWQAQKRQNGARNGTETFRRARGWKEVNCRDGGSQSAFASVVESVRNFRLPHLTAAQGSRWEVCVLFHGTLESSERWGDSVKGTKRWKCRQSTGQLLPCLCIWPSCLCARLSQVGVYKDWKLLRSERKIIQHKYEIWVNLWKYLRVLTCYNISEHGLESWEVAALKLVQKPRHAPHLYRSQLIINVFQILRPAAPGEEWTQVNIRKHKSRCDDPPSDRERKPASGCFRRGLCSQNSEDQSLSVEHRFRGAARGGSSREHCCDHLVAQKLGSWRSLALAGRFGVGWERCQGKAAGGGPRSRSAEWSETRQEDGASQHGVQVGLEPYRHAWSHDMQGQGHLPQTSVCLLLSKRLISTMINRSTEMERKRGNEQEQ